MFGRNPSIEEWRPVVGMEGYYEVSNLGRVRGVARIIPRGGRSRSPFARKRMRILSPGVTVGHHNVSLYRLNRPKRAMVHRLVLEAFVGPCPDGMECCHNDGNGLNNHLSNLR